MSFNAVRRTIKRAAATLAEEKIKETLDDEKPSSESSECRRLSEFDGFPNSQRKKPCTMKKAKGPKQETTKDSGPPKAGISGKQPTASDLCSTGCATSDSKSSTIELSSGSSTRLAFSSDSCSMDGPSSIATLLSVDEHEELSSHERRKASRRQHSNRTIRLSRRHSRRLSDPRLSPYMFSPLAPAQLLFSPSSARKKATKIKTRPAH